MDYFYHSRAYRPCNIEVEVTVRHFSGKTGVVVGCGKAGLSVVRFLLDRGADVRVSEGRALEQLDPALVDQLRSAGVELECGGHTRGFIAAGDFVVVSPGISLDQPAVHAARAQGIPLYGELALAADGFKVPVIAVTGSNGKTTVTSLLGEILGRDRMVFVGGNIGTPLLDYFLEPPSYRAVVLELSSFQLELVGSFRPDIALFLNISPDHLDRHHTLEEYARAKWNLTLNQRQGDQLVLGGDDPLLATGKVPQGVSVTRFGIDRRCEARIDDTVISLHLEAGEGPIVECYPLDNTALVSPVNRLNAAAAVLAARLAGCGSTQIAQGLENFQPPMHRMTEVAVIDGVRYINDSKATNLGALEAALLGSEVPVVLIAGGRGKGTDLKVLEELVEKKVRRLILIGEAADMMQKAWGERVPSTVAGSMEEAVQAAHLWARAGDQVLLAPGCASYDMFPNYEKRGEAFMESVRRLERVGEQKQVNNG